MILRATLEACVRMDYPHRTFLCDDGGTEARVADPEKGPGARQRAEQLKALCAELGVTYVTRPKNEHAKAGNLNHALRQTDGEFVIILDADHVPEPHFITRLIGYFANEKMAYVQTPHAFYNFDSFQSQNDHNKRKYWEEGALFYEVIQPGRNRWGCPIFAGSAAMFRRTALAEVNYIALETITEDMHTGLRINALGWKSMAISERLVAGQAAPDITTFHSQRLRWGEGNLSIMAHDNPLTTKGLSLAQRLCYLGSMVHWCGGLFKLVIYLTPILMMISGIAPLKELTLTLGAITLAYLLVSLFGVLALGKGHGSIVNGEFFCMVNFWTQIRGTMRALFKRKNQTFVVTNKRGRQSKSAWPFVYPHLVLATLSVVALGWGWSRYLYGVSEDLVRPLIPTVWIVIHLGLIWMVIRRALWPEDQRFSYRHATNVAVDYALADGTTGCGVTSDLSDQGVGFVSYAEIPVGTVVELRIKGGGEEVRTRGVVKRLRRVSHDTYLGAQGYQVGVKLEALTGKTLDAMNRLMLHYAVPRLYQEYHRGNRRTWLTNLGSFVHRVLFGQRGQSRRLVRLPAVVTKSEEFCFETVTEDLSPGSTAVLLTQSPRVGDEVGLTIHTPLGEASGVARVARVTEQRIGARQYHRTALVFRDPLGPGYSRIQHLFGGRASRTLKRAINPDDRLPKRVPTFGAGATVALAACLLLAMAGLSFPFAHQDELFLREVALADRPATPEQAARIDRIYARTLDDSYPSTDRLVLLMRAMRKASRTDDCDPLIIALANRDKANPDLRLALAAALDRKQEYAAADVEYRALLAEIETGRLSGPQWREAYLAAARNRVNAGDLETGLVRFAAYLGEPTEDPTVRDEYSGVLIRAGRHRDVPALFRGVEPDHRGRVRLMSALALGKDFAAAEVEGRKILATKPDDPEALLLIAELMANRREYAQARQIFQQLAARTTASPEMRLKLGQLQLLNHDFTDAIVQYQAVIASGLVTDEACRGFADAAAGAATLENVHRQSAILIEQRPETRRSTDAVFLSRLAYVLDRLQEYDRAVAISERAITLNPTDKEIIKQRYALLLNQGKTSEAIALLTPFNADPTMRLAIAQAHLKAKQFDIVEREARALRAAAPNDLQATRLLADVLSWKGAYPESLALFESLRLATPLDAAIPVRIAQVTLWSGDHDSALKQFEAILTQNFEQPGVWADFIDSSAAVKKLSSDQLQLLRRITQQTVVQNSQSATLLGRLAWALAREKQQDLADRFFNQAIALKPTDPTERKELARLLMAARRPSDALRQFDGLTDLTPTDHLQLASIHSALKEYTNAEKSCRAALAAQPADRTIERTLADVLSWAGKYEESLAIFRKLRAANPGDPELLVRLAEVTIWSGAPAEALYLLTGALETDTNQPRLFPTFLWAASAVPTLTPVHAPLLGRVIAKIDPARLTDAVSLARLALVQHRIGKPEAAAGLIDQAMKIPDVSRVELRELASILGRMDRVTDALGLFEGKPLTVEDRAVLAELATASRDWVNAERQYRAVLAFKPDDAAMTIRLADVISLKGNHEEARITLDPLLQKMPQGADLLTASGDISLRAGDKSTAVLRYEAALKARPDHLPAQRGFIDAAATVDQLTPSQFGLAVQNADVLTASSSVDPASACRLAWVMIRHHEIARADKLLDRCVAATLTPQAVRRELAPILAARGRGREALQVLDGLRSEPDDLLVLADVYASLKDFPAAIKECKTYLAARQGDAKAERKIADLLVWNGEYDEALRSFRLLRTRFPADLTLQVRIAETLWRINRHAEAMDILVRILGEGMTAQVNLPGGPLGVASDVTGARVAFVTTAFESEKITPPILQTADLIRPAVGQAGDPLLLARLGYVFHRAGRTVDAAGLLDRAVTTVNANDHEARWLLGGILNLAGRSADATRMWVGLPSTAEHSQRLALLYASANDYKSALSVCDDVLKIRPGDRKLERLRADLLSWNRDYAEAITILKKLNLTESDDVELAVRLAEVNLWAKNHAEALRLSEAQVRKAIGGSKSVRVFLEAAGMSGNLTVEQANLVVKCHRELPFVAEPDDALFAGRVGLALRAAGATRDSEVMFDRAIKEAPRDPRGRRTLAGLLAIAGRSEHAFKLYEGTDPEPGDLLQLAYLNLGRKDYIAAEKAARAYIAANPADAVGERALADILAGNGNHQAALVIFNRLQAARPKDAELAIRVAEVRLASDDRATAAVVFAQAVEERLSATGTGAPSAGLVALDARVRSGFAAAVAGLPEPSPRYVDLAAKLAKNLTPDDPDHLTAGRLGVILARAGRQADAAILVDRVAKIEAKEPQARRELAGIMAAVGQGRRALLLLEGLDLTTEDRLMVAGLQASVGELAAAVKTCRAAVAATPADDRAVRMLADVLSWNKEFKEAATLFDKLLRTNPTDKALQLRLAEAQLGNGDYDAAAERFLTHLSDPIEPRVATSFLAAVANVKVLRADLQKAARRIGELDVVKASTDATFLLNLAWAHHRCAAAKECELFLNVALALKPQDPAVRRNLSAVLEVAGRHEEALAAMEGLMLDDADRLRLAGLHLALKDYVAAEMDLGVILDRTPTHAKARRLLAEVMIGRKNFPAALGILERLAAEAPGDREIALRTAETLLADKNYEASLVRFRELLLVEIEFPALWAGYVDAAASSKKLTPKDGELAIRIAEQSEKDSTRPAEFWSRLAWVLLRSNHPTKTLRLIDRALALKPTDPDVKRELAGVLSALGRNREALALYDGMDLTMVDKVRVTEMVIAVQDFDRAEKLLEELLAADPNDRKLRRLRGNLLTWRMKYPEAIKEFEALRREIPNDLDVLKGLALATLWKGDADKAISMLHDILGNDPDQRDLWRPYLDAVSLMKSPQPEHKKVVEQLADKVEDSKLNDADTFGGLGVALAKIGQSDRAILMLRKAVQVNPKSDALQLRLAETLTAAGRFAEADKIYAALLSRQSANRTKP